MRGESYFEDDLRAYRDVGIGLVRRSSGDDQANRDDILGGALPALPPKNAPRTSRRLRPDGGQGGHLHVAQEVYVEEDVRVRKALGVGHARRTRGGPSGAEGDRDDILGKRWTPTTVPATVPRGDPRIIGDVDIMGELYVEEDARVRRNVCIGHARTAIGTTAAERADIRANATETPFGAGPAPADPLGALAAGHLDVADSVFAAEELRVAGRVGVGHAVGDAIPGRGGGGVDVPVLDVANDGVGANARVFVHDPANVWWRQDPQSLNDRAGQVWRGNLASSLPAYSLVEVDHDQRRAAAGDTPVPAGWPSYFGVDADRDCSYTVVPAGVSRDRHPTFSYTIRIESAPGSDAEWPPASVSFDVPSPLLGWELGGPGNRAGGDVARPEPGIARAETRFYTLRGCNLRQNPPPVYARP